MHASHSSTAIGTGGATLKIGALAPLSSPGWVEAGSHLLAGIELAVHEVNQGGGIEGSPLDLIVRDTAAQPLKAAAAVDELARAGVAAIIGEYHSVVARAAAARAEALGLPFLCSSAVIDALTDQPATWVARLAPPQSHGWRIYADFLLSHGHRRIAVATQGGDYWQAGTRILRDHLDARGGTLAELDMRQMATGAVCDALHQSQATALLLLVGFPEPAVSIVKMVRNDPRVCATLIGAPAGQPEFDAWARLLGNEACEIAFLRYMPQGLGTLGLHVQTALLKSLGVEPSFVAFEGYDAITVVADILRREGRDPMRLAEPWSRVSVEGTRGRIAFSRTTGATVWQCTLAPVQIVARDLRRAGAFRVISSDCSTLT